jgi:hypothetical protein
MVTPIDVKPVLIEEEDIRSEVIDSKETASPKKNN